MRHILLAAAASLALAGPAFAQTAPAAPPPATAPAANPSDVASPEAIVDALYQVISGDKGVARDWDRFRSLFHPTGRLQATARRSPDSPVLIVTMTPDGYIERSGAWLVENGFHERELARRSERYGRIAHVFSTYDSKRTVADPEPFARGINSIQLFDDGTRWWIVSVYWQGEDAQNPLPPQYLP